MMEGYSIVVQKHPSKHLVFTHKYVIASKMDGLREGVRGTSIKTYDRKVEVAEEMTRRIVALSWVKEMEE